jgi:CubicO group peptidase (beta-lactamase class C family)
MTTTPSDRAESDLRRQVDSIVAHYVGAKENVGLVVGITHGGRRHVFGWGHLARDSTAVPDGQTVFEIGSITKLFTVNLLTELMLAGRVRLMDPVGKFLPPSVQVPTYHGHEITLFHLATHTSSLPRLPNNLWPTVKDQQNPYANYTVDDLYRFLNGYRLRRMVGSKIAYSNLGMGLLGHILALVDGRPYEQAVVERLCRPLGMADTTTTLSPDQRQRLAHGHDESGKPVSGWDLPTLPGAGAFHSTAGDMLRYLEANLGAAPDAIKPALMKCQIRRPLTAKPQTTWRHFALASVLAAGGLAVQKWWPLPPGSLAFVLTILVPAGLAARWGGLWPGLWAAALSVAGTYELWGKDFGWDIGAVMAGFVAWYFSRARREAARGAMLGWQTTRRPDGTLLLWHNGGTGGYASWCGIVKETQTGVVVLSNSANDVDALGEGVLACAADADDGDESGAD